MYAIIGLGNPGREYEWTRHNAGYEVINKLAYDYNIDMNKMKFKAIYGEGRIGNQKVLLIKPTTYMNLSGESVREFVNFYKLEPENIIVTCDDINLPVGYIRIRSKGSDGGQKGLRNIIAQLGYDNFARVRVGVGEKPPQWDLAKYVLSRFLDEEKDEIISGMTDAADAITMIIKEESTQSAMNKYNKKAGKNEK
jgi:PTH1 family peptidyl-tRNA hydrolase